MSAPQPEAATQRPKPNWRLRMFRILASILTGFLMVWAAPDDDIWLFGFIGWIPWLWAIDGLKPKHAFFYGWFAGIIAEGVGFYWITELLMRFGGFHVGGAFGIHLLFSLAYGTQWAIPAALIAWAQQSFRKRQQTGSSSLPTRLHTLWIAPLAWAAVETTLPNIFPAYLALLWAWHPVWLQTAEIGGPSTVSFIMLACNAAFYEVGRGVYLEKKWLRRPIMHAVLVPALTWLYGQIRMSQVQQEMDEAPKVKFGVVQGNFGIKTYARRRNKLHLLSELQRVSAELEEQGAEILVWGETAYPFMTFYRDRTEDLPENSKLRARRGFTVPAIIGAITRDRLPGGSPYAWNTAIVLNEDDSLGDRYDKNYPLLFGEAAPPGIDPEWYLEMIPSASHLNSGDGPGKLTVNGYSFGPLICYEDLLPDFTRRTANEGIHAFVNLTNDSWFGNNREQGEHLGLSVLRTIETRKGMLRTVNAGASAYIDPLGAVHHRTEVTDSDVEGYTHAVGFVAEVPMMDPEAKTVFMYTGYLFTVGMWLGVGFFVLPLRRRKTANS